MVRHVAVQVLVFARHELTLNQFQSDALAGNLKRGFSVLQYEGVPRRRRAKVVILHVKRMASAKPQPTCFCANTVMVAPLPSSAAAVVAPKLKIPSGAASNNESNNAPGDTFSEANIFALGLRKKL